MGRSCVQEVIKNYLFGTLTETLDFNTVKHRKKNIQSIASF